MVWMLFMCLRLLQMFQKLLAKVLISETTFVCFFFLHCSPEYIFTKSPAFFLLFLKQQQCLEFKKKQIMFYLGAHSMSFKQTIRIVWTNCLFSDRYFFQISWAGRRVSAMQARRVMVRRAVWGLEPAGHRKSLSCNQYRMGDLCYSLIFWRALHLKNELEKYGLL